MDTFLVRGIEKFDGVPRWPQTQLLLMGVSIRKPCKASDDGKDNNGEDEVHEVEETLTSESLAKGVSSQVKSSMKRETTAPSGTLATSNVDGGGRECLLDNGLQNIGGNAQIDAA